MRTDNNKYLINPKYGRYGDFVRSLPDEFDKSGRLVYDSRNQVRLFDAPDGQVLVVKRFKVPMLHQRIDYTFIRPSKAKRAYTFALRLVELGINTPEPIACVETRRHGLFHYGYFVSTYCPDPDVRFLRDGYEGYDDLIDAIARFIADMHGKGFVHGDVNLSNFLYRKEKGGYHLTTIDINRSHFYKRPSVKQCLGSLVRLTHVRPLLREIVVRYAELRGWDPTASYDFVERKLSRFERLRRHR